MKRKGGSLGISVIGRYLPPTHHGCAQKTKEERTLIYVKNFGS
jgi:hypothetical protein